MNETELNEKLDFYMQEKVKIHIDLFDGTFLNGFIIKNSKENVWWMQEDKLGQVFVFIKDISVIEQFRNKVEKEVC